MGSTIRTKLVGILASVALLPTSGLTQADIEQLFVSKKTETAAEQAVETPQLALVTNDLSTLVTILPRPELTITVVESEIEAKARTARAIRTKRTETVYVAKADTPADVPFEQKRALAQAAAAAYGIDWKIVEAVWQIESGKRWQTAVRSSAGAQGPMQFMPGTWRAYAVDGNGDGVADVNDARDAVYAGARYLAANGAATNIDHALFRYNHAQWYVDKVKGLASSIEG